MSIQQVTSSTSSSSIAAQQLLGQSRDWLSPIRQWLDNLQIDDPKLARFLYKTIPGQCPFERDIVLFGHKLGHIPPLCKLNPLYEQLVSLRFRSLCYLVDVCGEMV